MAVESYKFARMYPLTQKDTLHTVRHPRSAVSTSLSRNSSVTDDDSDDIPTVDFTPAKLITLLFTDLGVLTPAAVSDELIRLYQ